MVPAENRRKNERKLNCITAAWPEDKTVLARGIEHEDLTELEMVFKKTLRKSPSAKKKEFTKNPSKSTDGPRKQ